MGTDGLILATGPVSWGVDFADRPENPPWESVLDEIEGSGLRALELGPVGYLPEEPVVLRAALSRHSLTAVGSFVFESLHDPGARGHVLQVARRACRAIAGADGGLLVIIDRPGRVRAATAGRSSAAPRLSRSRWLTFVSVIDAIAELAKEHSLTPAFHPHAGSYVEFADEIDRLLADSEVALCLDTGHVTYAGIPAHDAIEACGARLAHLHLKDIDPRVLDRVRREPLGFWDAIAARVFCPVGQGAVDLMLVRGALERINYCGFATIEQDRVPGSGTPLDDLRQSLDVLAAAGIGSDPPGEETR
jgi:inosose dehydratase